MAWLLLPGVTEAPEASSTCVFPLVELSEAVEYTVTLLPSIQKRAFLPTA